MTDKRKPDRYRSRPWELWLWRLAAWMTWGYFIGVLLEEFGGR